MIIYVLDQNFERIATLDVMASIIWTNRYYTYGDCELYISVTDDNLAVLKENNYLVREGHEENLMIIRKIQIDTDIEVGNYMTVTGQCLKSLLYRRIIWNLTAVSGVVESCIDRLLQDNIISPSDSIRLATPSPSPATLATLAKLFKSYT